MSIFSEDILKLLNNYKRMLKRYITSSEREKTIINLGIKRKSLKFDNDVILHNKAQRVLQDIEYWKAKINRVNALEYSGINEFYHYLKTYLNNYRVENNAIIHVSQKASCALVQAIQIIVLPEEKLSASRCAKLNDCVQTIIKFGTTEQKQLLAKALYEKFTSLPNSILATATLSHFVKDHHPTAKREKASCF